jgi:hypothetical protein
MFSVMYELSYSDETVKIIRPVCNERDPSVKLEATSEVAAEASIKKSEYCAMQCSTISERVLLFGRFPGFAHSAFSYEQRVAEYRGTQKYVIFFVVSTR